MLRIIPYKKYDGKFNMKVDEYFLKYSKIVSKMNSKDNILRFYGWKKPTITIGKNQKKTDIDIKYCKNNNIDIIRRITGGKAVYHNDELTYSFICNNEMLPKDLISSYEKISEALLFAMKKLGINAQKKDINEHKIKQFSTNCFLHTSDKEIVVDGKKMIGSAQRKVKDKTLQHGSILFRQSKEDKKTMNNIFKTKKQIDNFEKKMISINDINPKITKEDLMKAIILGFETVFNEKTIVNNLSDKELDDIKSMINKDDYEE